MSVWCSLRASLITLDDVRFAVKLAKKNTRRLAFAQLKSILFCKMQIILIIPPFSLDGEARRKTVRRLAGCDGYGARVPRNRERSGKSLCCIEHQRLLLTTVIAVLVVAAAAESLISVLFLLIFAIFIFFVRGMRLHHIITLLGWRTRRFRQSAEMQFDAIHITKPSPSAVTFPNKLTSLFLSISLHFLCLTSTLFLSHSPSRTHTRTRSKIVSRLECKTRAQPLNEYKRVLFLN